MTPEIATLVVQGRQAQGLPAKISDPATLARVAALLVPDQEVVADAA